MENEISVISLEKRFKKFDKRIKKTALKILEILKKNNVSVEIYLADGRKLRFLNRKFRGKDKTADVLSFEEPKGFIYPPKRGTTQTSRRQTRKIKRIGEIYLNADLSRKSQRKSASSPRESALLIHGLLHLFGYEHKKKNDRIRMMKIERLLIEKLKINPLIF